MKLSISPISKKVLIIAGGFIALCTSVMLLVATYWIIKSGASQLNIHNSYGTVQNQKLILEEQALIQKDLLKTYYLFSEETNSYDSWLSEKKQDGSIVDQGDVFLILRDIEVESLKENHCQTLYCFQHKLGFAEIPSNMWRGLIGIEDYRFLSHQGVDPLSILRAIIVDLKSMRFVQGGSTLTMQLVKNLFLSSEKSIVRKLKEMVLAFYIEITLDKEDILTAYFNEVWWGSLQGVRIKGLYSASMLFFQKKPQFLSEFEVSILVSMLKGPGFYHPVRHIDRLKQRSNVVFDKLKDLNLILGETETMWTDKDWQQWQAKLVKRNLVRDSYAAWLTSTQIDAGVNPIEKLAFNLGVEKVRGFLDSRIGKNDLALKFIQKEIACSTDCKGFSYYSKYERDKVIALNDEKHQTGSIFKPIIYSLFYKHGIAWDDLVKTGPFSLNLKSGKWSPGEAYELEEEEITVIDAVKLSRNRPTIRLAEQVGFDVLENELQSYFTEIKSPLKEYPSQIIGAVEMSVAGVVSVYEKFIRKECLQNSQGASIPEESVLTKLSNPSEVTIKRVVNEYLKPLRFFGKTGTTNKGLDSWYIAFDGRYLYALWFGLEGSREDKKLLLSGASSAFRFFQAYKYANGKRFHELSCLGI